MPIIPPSRQQEGVLFFLLIRRARYLRKTTITIPKPISAKARIPPGHSTKREPRFHRDKTSPGGVLLRVPQSPPSQGDSWHWEYSPDDYFEEEILLHGIRMDAEVIP
jgi:hypothetical protein